jgi:hypothetical protein
MIQRHRLPFRTRCPWTGCPGQVKRRRGKARIVSRRTGNAQEWTGSGKEAAGEGQGAVRDSQRDRRQAVPASTRPHRTELPAKRLMDAPAKRPHADPPAKRRPAVPCVVRSRPRSPPRRAWAVTRPARRRTSAGPSWPAEWRRGLEGFEGRFPVRSNGPERRGPRPGSLLTPCRPVEHCRGPCQPSAKGGLDHGQSTGLPESPSMGHPAPSRKTAPVASTAPRAENAGLGSRRPR